MLAEGVNPKGARKATESAMFADAPTATDICGHANPQYVALFTACPVGQARHMCRFHTVRKLPQLKQFPWERGDA